MIEAEILVLALVWPHHGLPPAAAPARLVGHDPAHANENWRMDEVFVRARSLSP